MFFGVSPTLCERIYMKKIIVTGCNGQLGRAVNDYYKNSTEYELVNTDTAEGFDNLDITDLEALDTFFDKVRPYAVINCAAFTNVDACETKEDIAFKVNAIGPRNLAIVSEKYGAKLVHISTDYVFEGNEPSPRKETDPTGPIGAYGRTKLAGENFVKAFSNHYFIIRTAWLYGDGKNFVRTMLGAAKTRDEVSVVSDQIGSPTSAKELAKAIGVLVPTENYGTFHGTCEGVCSWAEFTEEIYRLAGVKTRVKHITSDQYPSPTKRPAYSVLDNYMFRQTTDFEFADWKDAIREYLESEK